MIQLPRYESYKDSGVQWLGEIPSHWAVKRLKFLLSEKLKYGANESAESEDKDQPRYIRITDIDESGNLREDTFKSLELEKAQEYLLDDLDILLARSGATVGKSYLHKKDKVGVACYAGYLIRARFNQENYDPKFINLFLQSKAYWSWIESVNIQATIQNVSAEKYNDFALSIPSLEEQNIIADFLDKRLAQVDALIAKQETLLEKLAEQREALISHAVTKGLNPDVELKDSGDVFFGKIPKHWKVIALHFIVRLISGDSITALDFVADGDYPVYGGNGFRGYIDRYTHQGNYVLIGRQGALCGNINFASGYFFATEHAVVVNPLIDLNYKWLGFLLMAMNLNQYSTTAAQPGISAEVIGRLKILLPEIEEQNQIADFIETELRDIEELENKAIVLKDKLKEYRSTLITQVVTGKIDVRKHQIN